MTFTVDFWLKKKRLFPNKGELPISGISIRNEIDVYDKAETSLTGETGSYDAAVFPNVIRKREIELIGKVLKTKRPRMILDYGCGGGWLSLLLSRWGYDVVGIDVSIGMIRRAALICHEADFIVCDAMRLPFREKVFDCMMGISILHHLNLVKAFQELKRISSAESRFVFMEPNLLNPLSAIGRKLLPMEQHTKEEKQFLPEYLRAAFSLANFNLERYFALFFLSFPIARLCRIARVTPHLSLIRIITFLENIMEKSPGVSRLNSTIVAIGKTNG
jgi:SAM-dependent methyltransferase